MSEVAKQGGPEDVSGQPTQPLSQEQVMQVAQAMTQSAKPDSFFAKCADVVWEFLKGLPFIP